MRLLRAFFGLREAVIQPARAARAFLVMVLIRPLHLVTVERLGCCHGSGRGADGLESGAAWVGVGIVVIDQ